MGSFLVIGMFWNPAQSLLLCDKHFIGCPIISRSFSPIAFISKHCTLTLKMTSAVPSRLGSLLLVGSSSSDAVIQETEICCFRQLVGSSASQMPEFDFRSSWYDLRWVALLVPLSSSALSPASPWPSQSCESERILCACAFALPLFWSSTTISLVSPEDLPSWNFRALSLFRWLLSLLKVSPQLLSPEMSIPSTPPHWSSAWLAIVTVKSLSLRSDWLTSHVLDHKLYVARNHDLFSSDWKLQDTCQISSSIFLYVRWG